MTAEMDEAIGQDVILADAERALEAIDALNEPETLLEMRRRAWERYLELPMPTRKTEEWRYTDITNLRLESFRPAMPSGAAGGQEAGGEGDHCDDRHPDQE
jgi:hypothetical protein